MTSPAVEGFCLKDGVRKSGEAPATYITSYALLDRLSRLGCLIAGKLILSHRNFTFWLHVIVSVLFKFYKFFTFTELSSCKRTSSILDRYHGRSLILQTWKTSFRQPSESHSAFLEKLVVCYPFLQHWLQLYKVSHRNSHAYFAWY
jgi:hypothetical protein